MTKGKGPKARIKLNSFKCNTAKIIQFGCKELAYNKLYIIHKVLYGHTFTVTKQNYFI